MAYLRFIVLAILLGPGTVLACTCMQRGEITRQTVIDAYCKAEVVLLGSVESSREVKRSFFEFEIRPDRNFKGNDESPVYALSALGGMCGYPFRAGGYYLIFASRHKETHQLSASICGWTQPVGKASFFIEVINELVEDGQDPCSDDAAPTSPDAKIPEKKKRRQVI